MENGRWEMEKNGEIVAFCHLPFTICHPGWFFGILLELQTPNRPLKNAGLNGKW
jgi:hypothetical protein